MADPQTMMSQSTLKAVAPSVGEDDDGLVSASSSTTRNPNVALKMFYYGADTVKASGNWVKSTAISFAFSSDITNLWLDHQEISKLIDTKRAIFKLETTE